ncbi:MAG: ABC transporter permease [Coprococcus sp.]|nr:ABC transporter permease [Coprococcus sp.]
MKNMHKLAAVAQMKWLSINGNMTIAMGPLMVVAMVWGFKILYRGFTSDGALTPFLISVLLNLGLTMNICSEGFIMVGTGIAEEKEKHTLRVLMTSSITGLQYFVGSILFPFLFLMAINYAVLLICGVPLTGASLFTFTLISIVASLTSCVLGMIVGICAKNQMNANLIAYPLMMVFMMVPLLGNLSEGLHTLSGFLFTGILTGMTERLAYGETYTLAPIDIAVLFGELIISVLVFLILYKRNGFEKD